MGIKIIIERRLIEIVILVWVKFVVVLIRIEVWEDKGENFDGMWEK